MYNRKLFKRKHLTLLKVMKIEVSFELTGEAKVQGMGDKLFIYLPIKRCNKRGIVKGSRILYMIKNSGMPPEAPNAPNWQKKDIVPDKPEIEAEEGGEPEIKKEAQDAKKESILV